MTDMPSNHITAVRRIHQRIVSEVQRFAMTLIDGHNEHHLKEISKHNVKMMELSPLVTVLKYGANSQSGVDGPQHFWQTVRSRFRNDNLRSEREQDKWEKRELFIKFVRAEYDDMIDHRAVILPPERHEASRLLLNSTMYAMDDLSNLGDWEVRERELRSDKRPLRRSHVHNMF